MIESVGILRQNFAATFTRKNWSTNPAAENDLTGWTNSSAAIERRDDLTGMNRDTGLRVTVAGSGFIKPGIEPAAPGEIWTISFDLKNNSGSADAGGRTVFIAFTRDGASDVFPESPSTGALGPNGTVQRFSHVCAAAPALANGIYFILDNMNRVGIEVTGYLLEKVSTVGSYFDGGTPGAIWNGTPGNSTSEI